MLNFRKAKLEDRGWVTECVENGDTDGCCYSFGNLIAWGDSYSLEIAEFEGMCLMRSNSKRGMSYTYPSGRGDVKKAVLEMMEQAYEAGQPFRMHQLLEENKKALEEMFPDMFEFTYNRDMSEYVYSVKNMAELPGKRFHGKKGHVNAFFRKHTDVSCDPITSDNIHLCIEIARSWLSGKDEEDKELIREFRAIERSIKYFDELGFMGAILYADGKPVAFTMGEPLKNNTFCTHYEKTIPEYRDAFPVINNGFTKLMLLSYDYVNREEDTGSEGLRKAKLSYHPEFLLDKYNARLKNDPARKYYADDKDFAELSKLWMTVFGDDVRYPEYFLNHSVKPSDIYAYREDGKIVSAFYLVDSQLVIENNIFSGKYLYAAATLPEYRKKGIMSSMIKEVVEYLEKDGTDFICLYPANETLYGYYEKLGFRVAFNEHIYKTKKKKLQEYSSARYFNCCISYEEIRKYIPSESYVLFDGGYLDFARFCTRECGFEISAAFDDEDKVFVTGHMSDRTAVVDEAISQDGNYTHIMNVLADIDCDNVLLKTPECIILEGFECETNKSGMLLSLNDDMPEKTNIYMGQPCM